MKNHNSDRLNRLFPILASVTISIFCAWAHLALAEDEQPGGERKDADEWQRYQESMKQDEQFRERQLERMLRSRRPINLPSPQSSSAPDASPPEVEKEVSVPSDGRTPSPEAQWEAIQNGAAPLLPSREAAPKSGHEIEVKHRSSGAGKSPSPVFVAPKTREIKDSRPSLGEGASKKSPGESAPNFPKERSDGPDEMSTPRGRQDSLQKTLRSDFSPPSIGADGLPSFYSPPPETSDSAAGSIPAPELSFSSLRSPEASPKNRVIFDIYGGGGDGSSRVFSTSLNLRVSDWIFGIAEERAQWLDAKTNTGKYTESTFFDVCAAVTFETSWLSIQPCYRYGKGRGRFRQRDALNEIREFERTREVFRFYGRFVLLVPLWGDERLAIEGISGYSQDVFLYGPYSQFWIKTPLLGFSIGAESFAGQRNAFLAGFSFGALNID